jgi:hypothetical protein
MAVILVRKVKCFSDRLESEDEAISHSGVHPGAQYFQLLWGYARP